MKMKTESNDSNKPVYVGTKSGVHGHLYIACKKRPTSKRYCIFNKYSLSFKG